MNVDKALANFCNSSELRRGGDTGRRRVEHRNFLQLRFTHQSVRFRLLWSVPSKGVMRNLSIIFHCGYYESFPNTCC